MVGRYPCCGRLAPPIPSEPITPLRRRVQRLLGPSVPVMIFTALWSWFWVWLCVTHPCGRVRPLLWSAGPSHSCRTDNRTGCVCTTSARSQRPCNDIHGPVVVVLGVAVLDTPLWSGGTLVVVGWPLPSLLNG